MIVRLINQCSYFGTFLLHTIHGGVSHLRGLRVDHVTFDGEGGRIGLCKSFFSLASGAGTIFLGLCIHFFSHVACFFDCKGFAGNFFLKSSTPPLKGQMVHPLEEPIKHL